MGYAGSPVLPIPPTGGLLSLLMSRNKRAKKDPGR